MKDDSQKHVTIAILQDANKMEIENAIDIANATQTSFHYTLHPLLIEIDKPKYELPNGAYDFNHAIDDLRQQPHIKKLIPRNLIFVTSLPYSDKNLVDEFQGKSLLDELN